MGSRSGPQPRRRTSGSGRGGRGQVFRHEYCTISHRSPETAARCAASAPVRARQAAAQRAAAEEAAVRAAKIAAASDARAARAADKARRRQQREVKAGRGGAGLLGGAQRPNHWVRAVVALVAIVVIAVVLSVVGAHHDPGAPVAQQRTSGTITAKAAAHQASNGRHHSTRRHHATTSARSRHAAARPLTEGCRAGNPLANVYHADRLEVRNRCLRITGTVAYVVHEDDGDIHVDLSLPSSEAHLLNGANEADQYGQLVAEIVPADEPGCTPGKPPRPAYGSYNYGICTGADITAPPVGAQVVITGPYVLDADHGWMEIHPIWAIKVVSGPPVSSAPALPSTAPPTTAPPATNAPPAPPATTAPAGAWCTASASPANDGYPDSNVYVTSNQPDQEATASDGGHSWSDETDSSGSVTILLYNTTAGSTITVTVGAASCSTTAA
jgi:hypothetical protein